MEDWIEIEGRTKRDAIERACNALNTNETHLKYEILEESSGRTKIKAMKLEQPHGADKADEMQEPSEDQEDQEMDKAEPRPATREAKGPLAGDGKQAKEFLETIVKFIDEKAQVELKENEEEISLEVRGERGGLLIGKYGQTLGALQYLVSRMAGLDRVDTKRLVLDSEQYRARRKESLETLARRLADKAIRNGRPVGAEPMNAADRRIMHMALSEDQGVTTKSIGEGSSRRILIVPKGSESRRGGGRNGRRMGGGGGRGRSPRMDPPRRRSGPKPRMHDSFDAPPEPENDFFEEDPDAPMLDDELPNESAQFAKDEE